MAKAAPSTCHLVLQEGGSSSEMYAHGFDSLKDAKAYRRRCAKAAYRTSDPIPVPKALLDHPDFWEVAEAIARAALEVDY